MIKYGLWKFLSEGVFIFLFVGKNCNNFFWFDVVDFNEVEVFDLDDVVYFNVCVVFKKFFFDD